MLCRNEGLAHFNCVKTSKYERNYSLIDGWTRITKIWEKPQNPRRQKGDMKHVPYRGPTNVRRHRKPFSRHCDLSPGIFALPLNRRKLENIAGIFDVTTDFN